MPHRDEFPKPDLNDLRWYKELQEAFPGAMSLDMFQKRLYEIAVAKGIKPASTLACVGVCRDEATDQLVDAIEDVFGASFNMSSLAGLNMLGKTGMTAAHGHACSAHGSFAYFQFTHIGMISDGSGVIGTVQRPEMDKPTTACGALCAFQNEYKKGKCNVDFDNNDIEYSIMKQRLFRTLDWGACPNLVELTKVASQCATEDLKNTCVAARQGHGRPSLMLTGVQIHTQYGDFVWVGYAHFRPPKMGQENAFVDILDEFLVGDIEPADAVSQSTRTSLRTRRHVFINKEGQAKESTLSHDYQERYLREIMRKRSSSPAVPSWVFPLAAAGVLVGLLGCRARSQ